MRSKYFLFLCALLLNSCYAKEVVINSKEHYDIKYPKVITKCDIPLNITDNLYTIETDRGKIIRQKEQMIYFALSSSILYDKYLDVVLAMKNFLDDNTNVVLIIEGHSDSEGGNNANYKNAQLSRNRVLNVINAFGEYSERLIPYYYGDYIPYYSNTFYNKEMERRNRRVEFVIIKCEKDYNKYNDNVYEIYNKALQDYNIFLNYPINKEK